MFSQKKSSPSRKFSSELIEIHAIMNGYGVGFDVKWSSFRISGNFHVDCRAKVHPVGVLRLTDKGEQCRKWNIRNENLKAAIQLCWMFHFSIRFKIVSFLSVSFSTLFRVFWNQMWHSHKKLFNFHEVILELHLQQSFSCRKYLQYTSHSIATHSKCFYDAWSQSRVRSDRFPGEQCFYGKYPG